MAERLFMAYWSEGQDVSDHAVLARCAGEIGINGAAAHLVKPGDLVIICAYAQMDAQEARNFHPSILLLDEKNRIKHTALKSGHAA